MQQQGMTLMELILTVAIMALLAAIAIPNFARQVEQYRTRSTTEEIMAAIQLARTSAVTQNQRATLRNRGSWQAGWQAFTDSNNNGQLDAGERELFSSGPVSGVRVSANQPLRNYISFIGTGEARYAGSAGGAFQAGTMEICSESLDSGFSLVLARSGRVRISRLTAAECSD
ncbi:GspH/FimT family pseudopilin [Microbulbifer sp. YPW16]|uniref:GspH/FimT family pseudopilin n=1 Tax=Microbulbifer sp. YPW16 TaxID=2904242 RepID=UPI001E627073|nr:GspH/FimT family protein [Microbulbifer sp. YPW16]UHQ54546.1 GspH/FimT family pseudopilin [Microbulbifer sp. YPW16]